VRVKYGVVLVNSKSDSVESDDETPTSLDGILAMLDKCFSQACRVDY
jgi:hypothetical protein